MGEEFTGTRLKTPRPGGRVRQRVSADSAVELARIGDLFGIGDDDDLTDEGAFHSGVEDEVGDVVARS